MKEKVFYVEIIVLICIMSLIFNIGFAKIEGNSMKPKFNDGNLIIYRKSKKNLKRFDIIVFEKNDKEFIKRVIGLPGEIVEYKNNILYVNGREIEEKFKKSITKDFDTTDIINSNVIPADKILVLGDNRLYSHDSREFGLVNIKDVKGIFIFRIP